jgi:hypothetical protein
MENIIINKAIELMKSDFMQYPDYDDTIELTLLDAITVLLSQHIDDIDTCEIYDFLATKLKN